MLYVIGGFIVVRNLCYFFHFIGYVRPQLDKKLSLNYTLCNIVAVIATLTSFEVGYLPYSKALSIVTLPVKS